MSEKEKSHNFSFNGDSLTESFTRSLTSGGNQLPKIDPSKYTITQSGQIVKPNSTEKK